MSDEQGRPETGDTIECVACDGRMIAYDVDTPDMGHADGIGEVTTGSFGCPACGASASVPWIDGTRQSPQQEQGPGNVDAVRSALDQAGIDYDGDQEGEQ